MDTSLNVLIRNRDGVIFEGNCLSLTSYNKIGKFDILPKHANFITLVEKEIAIRFPGQNNRIIQIDNGVCKVSENKVIIFLGVKEDFTKV